MQIPQSYIAIPWHTAMCRVEEQWAWVERKWVKKKETSTGNQVCFVFIPVESNDWYQIICEYWCPFFFPTNFSKMLISGYRLLWRMKDQIEWFWKWTECQMWVWSLLLWWIEFLARTIHSLGIVSYMCTLVNSLIMSWVNFSNRWLLVWLCDLLWPLRC